LYPINFPCGFQLIKNIEELKVEKHFHFIFRFYIYRNTKFLTRKREGLRVEVGGWRLEDGGWRLGEGG